MFWDNHPGLTVVGDDQRFALVKQELARFGGVSPAWMISLIR